MPKIVVSDTSCFITLTNIGKLNILQELYKTVFTTSTVLNEFNESLPEWVKVAEPKDIQKQQLITLQIDKGEASAIVLALEIAADLIILDDYKARTMASSLGLEITGTLGVIIKAKQNGLITSIKPFLKQLKQTNFRITDSLIEEALKLAGEN